MIHSLQIDEFAALSHLDLTFETGLNVLSGASGQGKSTVLEALRFVCGLGRNKGLARLVRRGAKCARVELSFSLEPKRAQALGSAWAQRCSSGPVTVVRTIDRRGRSQAHLKGPQGALEALPLIELQEVGHCLAEVHGQGSAPRLVDESVQRDLLDSASRMQAARERFQVGRAQLVELGRQRDELAEALEARVACEESELDLRECLSALDPELGEHDRLLDEEDSLAQVAAWSQGLGELGQLFHGPGADWVQRLERVAARLEADPDDPVLAPLTEGLNLLERSRGALDDRLESLQEQRANLARVTERLRAYRSAARRAGVPPGELAGRWSALQEAPSVGELGLHLRTLDRTLAERWVKVLSDAAQLSRARERSARKLEKAVAPRLNALGLARGRFRIRVEAGSAEPPPWTHIPHQSVHPRGAPSSRGAVTEVLQRLPTAHGLDLIAFEFSPDSEVELAPLARASGGELSRLFLALGERAAGDAPVLVFDEVDQNLGARLGSQVGDCLADLGQTRQVLVVTHLAPVAARATRHVRIHRVEGAVGAEFLEGPARVEELALMIRGEPITEAARRQARELLSEVEGPTPQTPVAQPRPRKRRKRAKSA